MLFEKMMAQRPRSAVCLAVLRPNGQALAISRRNDTSKWGLPGGKVDAGESNLNALVRECFEEIGWEPDAQYLEPVYSGLCPGKGPDDSYWVTTYLWVGPMHPNLEDLQAEEGMALRWQSQADLCSGTSPFAAYNVSAFGAIDAYLQPARFSVGA